MQDDKFRSQILLEQIQDKDRGYDNIAIKGQLRWDQKKLKLLEEIITKNGEIQSREIKGVLKFNEGDLTFKGDQFKVVEDYNGRKKRITGHLCVGVISNMLGFIEVTKDENCSVISKRKISGLVKVISNDGIKVVETLPNQSQKSHDSDKECTDSDTIEREISGVLMVVPVSADQDLGNI